MTPITADDLAAIGDAIGRGPAITSSRPSIAPLLASAGLDSLAADASAAEVEAALVRLRESIDPATDDLTRATIRESIRTSHPAIPARMLDAALTPPAATRQDDDRPRRSQATRLVDLALAAGAELWHSPAGDPHVTLPADGHREHHRLVTRPVRDWLARRYHDAAGAAPGSQAIADALAVLAGMARYEGREHPTHVRVAGDHDRVYLDLGGSDWSVVAIDADGWRVVTDPPVRLLRARGMLPLPAPRRGGSIDALRDVLHVASDDDYRLIVGWLLGALRPTGPYPLLALAGEQGSGKSTAARVVRRLIDPHAAELRAEPRVIDDLMIAATRSRIVAIDNLSHVPVWMSDALCRISTGGALTRRELYTDSDEVIIEAMRPAIVTSIGDVVTRGDLLDRAIAVTLPVLPESARMPEAELWARYATVAPAVLGALLDGVASALARARHTQIDRLPRMADWAVWTTAAEPGIGWPDESILGAYRRMRDVAVETAIDGDPLAAAIRRITLPWSGTATELLDRLAPAGRQPRGWPESPRALAAALRRLAPGLRRVGIEIEHRRDGHDRTRTIEIRSTAPDDPDDPAPPRPRKSPDFASASSASSIANVYGLDRADANADDAVSGCVRTGPADANRPMRTQAPGFASAFASADSANVSGHNSREPVPADDADDSSGLFSNREAPDGY